MSLCALVALCLDLGFTNQPARKISAPIKPEKIEKASESQKPLFCFCQKLFKHNLLLYEGCQQAGLSANKIKEIEVRKEMCYVGEKDKHESSEMSHLL